MRLQKIKIVHLRKSRQKRNNLVVRNYLLKTETTLKDLSKVININELEVVLTELKYNFVQLKKNV